ncbi:hypothetical protein [Rhizobium sp. 007]|uniref:hypothetical protein n=1 Tax=Rhizobium sp. 007 TaxID=2785056 RepID=UPI00188E0031|nr:hypothetical protein [Rhizobium sp. 007]QPB24272.1 hypothetical protein ISN39_32355 [Rhizobium sp. 007]
MSKSPDRAVFAAAIAFLLGTAGGYAINEMVKSGQTEELEQEIARLQNEAQRKTQVDAPNDEEASAAIAKSGRSMRISECTPREALPGVTCTGIITTTTGSFAGTTQPGVLSFAKIDGAWTQIQ